MKKRILVTGGMGMISSFLVDILKKDENNEVIIADIKKGDDLRNLSVCHRYCEDVDEIFHCSGLTGSPRKTKEKPVDFMTTILLPDLNMLYAAQVEGVKKFLYTSSIAVLNPQTDKYPAWAKQTAETYIEAMRIQYPNGTKYFINRPANVYGYDPKIGQEDTMVITSLMHKFFTQKEVEIWGDGNQIRDFIYAKDVARAMITIMEKEPNKPINVCSGTENTIKEVVELIAMFFPDVKYYYNNKYAGDQKRVMDNSDLKELGFQCEVQLDEGIITIINRLKREKYGL